MSTSSKAPVARQRGSIRRRAHCYEVRVSAGTVIKVHDGQKWPDLSTKSTLKCMDGLGEHGRYGDENTRNAWVSV